MAIVGIWWVWLAVGLVLALIEVLLPGFIFLGFALAAVAMALLVVILPTVPATPIALAIFAGLALVAWIALRLVFRRAQAGPKMFDHDIND